MQSLEPQNDLLAALGETPETAAPVPATLSLASYAREEAVELAKESLDFLASLVMPEVMEFGFPPLFQAIWILMREKIHLHRDFSKLALGIPRGFAKTTFLKLFIVYCILFTDRRFFLIIGATAKLAENILADVADMLDEPNVKAVFGDWRMGMQNDRQSDKVFGYRGRNILLVALGAGSSLRGINRKNVRPDFILMDDMQTRENAKSPILSDDLLDWMVGTLMKTKANKRCLYAFVGNMYPYKGSILRQLRHNKEWNSVIVGALLTDGESIWPELRSKEDLLDEFAGDLAAGKPEIFMAEVLNDENAANNSSIDINAIPREPIGLEELLPQGAFIVIDPSGRKKNSDSSEIGHFSIYDGVPLLDELESGIMTPGQTIRNALRMAMRRNCFLVGVEAVAYQESLLYWFGVVCEQYGIEGIDFVELYPGTYSKNSRIKGMFAQIVETRVGDVVKKSAEILIADKLRSRVTTQIVQWNPLKTDNVDDILDLLAYAPEMIVKYGHLAAIRSSIETDDFANARVLTLEENTSF